MIFFFLKLYVDFQLMGNWIDAPNPQIVQGSAVFGKEFKVRKKLQEKGIHPCTLIVNIVSHLLLALSVFPHTLSAPTHTHRHTENFFFPQTHTHTHRYFSKPFEVSCLYHGSLPLNILASVSLFVI